jgi:hypothetical protein
MQGLEIIYKFERQISIGNGLNSESIIRAINNSRITIPNPILNWQNCFFFSSLNPLLYSLFPYLKYLLDLDS